MHRHVLTTLLLVAAAADPLRAQNPPPPTTAETTVAAKRPRAPRRQEVTPELARTAFASPAARELLERARVARITQDSALASYKAKAFQRLTIRLGVRSLDRVLVRTENVADVRWARGSGVWIEPTGRRAAAPMFGANGASMDFAAITPVPYFPGREALWTPSSYAQVAQAEVTEDDLLHPLATGAEAYYRYATGDSMVFRLPDGKQIVLRELRITARRAQWRAFVGSFWFDTERGALVRAAYRLSAPIDFWEMMGEEARREAEEAITEAEKKEAGDAPGRMARALMNPLRGNISAITVEYGLHEGRFWLPRQNVAEGLIEAGFLRMPLKLEERFDYESVNTDLGLAPVPSPADVGLAPSDTSATVRLSIGTDENPRPRGDTSAAAVRAREDSTIRFHEARADTLRLASDSARATGDTAKARALSNSANAAIARARRITARRESCATGTTHVSSVGSRYGGALRMAIAMPCDTTQLAHSPDLPGTIFDPGEDVYGAADAEQLLAALDFSLQPEWGPQPPRIHTGLDLLRYNRMEGLSPGVTVETTLGKGYSARAEARIGTGDWVPNGELSLMRSTGQRTLRVAAFHRLGVANDDWGAPLSFGASVANALYARDEGFYYRTYGAEIGGTREAPGFLGHAPLQWRLFAERQRSAGSDPNSEVSLADLFSNPRTVSNIDAEELTALGGAIELARTFGLDPKHLRLLARARTEAALTDRTSGSVGSSSYGRFVLDATLTRGLGGFSAAITGAAGSSVGDLPVQRAFFMGGLHTVRGQFARLPTDADGPRLGDAFWLSRTELARGVAGARLIGFYDIGWAGARDDFTSAGRPMSGAGVGVSLLDGLLRTDLSRGIWPEKRWRVDLQLGARF
jgi:hypothetical protein